MLSDEKWYLWFNYSTAIQEYQCDYYPGTDKAKKKPWGDANYEPLCHVPWMPEGWSTDEGTNAAVGDCSETYSETYPGVYRGLGVFMMMFYSIYFSLLFVWFR